MAEKRCGPSRQTVHVTVRETIPQDAEYRGELSETTANKAWTTEFYSRG